MTIEDIYKPQKLLALVKEYTKKGVYSEELLKNYSDEDILEAGKHLVQSRDWDY